jgi:hypothetical protein
VSDSALLASVTVSGTDPLDGLFRYANISPISLTAGEDYIVTGVYSDGGDPFMFGASSFSTSPNISFVGERYQSGNVLAFPSLTGGGNINGYFSANFKGGASAAPEPGTLALLALGGVGGILKRRRK